ncbi:MAG: pyrroline-5-carboxylate reductase [Candidatus Omnitrophica bacterium]|nr:pyrroline-5-carboxylate reductase [Candidatus Omnitrophota bacterium]
MKKIIGIIGFGNMGSAIAGRAKAAYQVCVFDKDNAKLKGLAGIDAAGSVSELINKSEIIILAVKPQDFEPLLNEIGSGIKDKLAVSIAAGVATTYVEKRLRGARVARVMPNMPAKIGKGVSCVTAGRSATPDDIKATKDIFANLGQVMALKEEMMDAATAVSGSGPGFYFNEVESRPDEHKQNCYEFQEDFISRLSKAAEAAGFDEKDAHFLAHHTVTGSELLLKAGSLNAAQLRDQVASKGGTTEAGLKVLQAGGDLVEAVKAAAERAAELSRKE